MENATFSNDEYPIRFQTLTKDFYCKKNWV